jgi:hypothetical protein
MAQRPEFCGSSFFKIVLLSQVAGRFVERTSPNFGAH